MLAAANVVENPPAKQASDSYDDVKENLPVIHHTLRSTRVTSQLISAPADSHSSFSTQSIRFSSLATRSATDLTLWP